LADAQEVLRLQVKLWSNSVNAENQAIREYLEYYTGLASAPCFAVLISGEWGSGKTWLVRDFFAQDRQPKLKSLYVSLYGANSFRDIENAFFAGLHPRLASKGAGVAARIVSGASTFVAEMLLSATIDGDKAGDLAKGLLANTDGYVLIFDDLERCGMDLSDVLGYINRFVEHDGYKVVIVCNEDRLDSKSVSAEGAPYSKVKEKLIGKSFKVKPEFGDASAAFIASIAGSKTAEFTRANIDVLAEIYQASGYNNLRIIRNALLDFCRIFEALDPKYTGVAELARELFAQFLVYSFEVQCGALPVGEIQNLESEHLATLLAKVKAGNGDASDAAGIASKYASVRLERPLVPAEFWNRFFVYGHVDFGALSRALDQTAYFYDEQTPDWQKLLDLWSLSEEEFKKYLNAVLAQWDGFAFGDVATVTQVVGLLFYLSRDGLVQRETSRILEEGRQFVDKLLESGALMENVDNWGRVGDVDGVIEIGNWGGNIPEFQEFVKYRDQRSREAVERALPKQAAELLKVLKGDGARFRRKLVMSNSSENEYWNVPVLPHIDVGEFLEVVLSMPPENMRSVGVVFAERYKTLGVAPQLAREKGWLVNLLDLAQAAAEGNPQTLQSLRLERFVVAGIRHALDNLKRFEAGAGAAVDE